MPGEGQPFLADEGDEVTRVPVRASGKRALLALSVLAPLGLLGLGVHSGSVVLPSTTLIDGLQGKAMVPSRVKVQVYGMAGCPYTRAFVESQLVEMMTNVADLVDFEFIPFGNSYYVTQTCGGNAEQPYDSYNNNYDKDTRLCWNRLCGVGSTASDDECFQGELVCQHGMTDGMMTSAWACAKALACNVSTTYFPFFQCTANHFLSVTSDASYQHVVRHCAIQTHLDAETLLTCSRNYDTLNKQARLTPPHDVVPLAFINGVPLENTKCSSCDGGIMKRICEENRAACGPQKPVCDALLAR